MKPEAPEMRSEIKPVSETNVDLVLPFVRAYHQFEGLKMTEKKRESSVRRLATDSALGGIWLIFDGTDPAGYIALCKGYSIEFGGHDAFIDEFFIRPESRGRGLGRKVLELIKTEAKKLGIRALHLEVAKSNTNARRLYSSAQFVTREKYTLMSIRL